MSKQDKSFLLVICELLISFRDIQIERVCVRDKRECVCVTEIMSLLVECEQLIKLS